MTRPREPSIGAKRKRPEYDFAVLGGPNRRKCFERLANGRDSVVVVPDRVQSRLATKVLDESLGPTLGITKAKERLRLSMRDE